MLVGNISRCSVAPSRYGGWHLPKATGQDEDEPRGLAALIQELFLYWSMPARRALGGARVSLLGALKSLNPLDDGVPSPIARSGSVTHQHDRAMRSFWWDGVFGESSEVVWFQYFTVFALTFGAGASTIGLLASLSS